MTDYRDDYSSLDIERRGDSFVLIREYEGQKSELELTDGEILGLARMFPSYARQLIAPTQREELGVFAWAPAPLVSYQMGIDEHHQSILLRLRDDWEAEFDFSFTATDARIIADGLVKLAQRLDEAPKVIQQ